MHPIHETMRNFRRATRRTASFGAAIASIVLLATCDLNRLVNVDTTGVASGTATKVGFATQPASTSRGATMSTVRVAVQDVNGDTVGNSTANVTLSFSANPGSATLGGTLTMAAVAGVATFSNLTVSAAGSNYSFRAASTGLTAAVSSAFNVVPFGAAAKLAFSVQPSAAGAGVAISPAVQVTVQDALGNTVTSATTGITLAITSGTGAAGAVLGGTLTRAPVAGVASFDNLTLDKNGSGYSLTATSVGLTPATSAAFAVSLGGASAAQSTASVPATGTAGAVTTITVQAKDAGGNNRTSTSGTVAVAVTGANTATASVTDNLNGTYTATYTPTLSGADNIAITLGGAAISGSPFTSTVAAGALQHFNVTNTSDVAVGLQTAGTSFNIRVRAKDANNNTVPSFTGTVVLTSTGTLTGAPITTVAFTSGELPSQAVTITNTGSFTITATRTGGSQTGTSATFTVSPGAASPATSTASVPAGTAGSVTTITVQAKDAGGNNRTNSTGITAVAASVTGANTATPAVTSNGNGTYTLTYTPTASGTDNVAIAMNVGAGPVAISGSPYASVVVSGTPDSWTTLTSMTSARYQAAAEAINGVLYVAGGNAGSGDTPTLQAYTAASGTWQQRASMPGGRYDGYGAGVISGELYVAGGWTTSPGLPNSNLFIYSPTSNTWRSATSMPILSGCGGSGVIANKLYVTTACNGFSGYFSFLHVYDPATSIWTALASSAHAHGDPAVGVIGGKLYVAGGTNEASVTDKTLEVYDPGTNSWTTRASMAIARVGASGAVVNGKLYVIGGQIGVGLTNSVEVYDPVANTWTTVAAMPTSRSFMGTGVINGIIYVAGGYAAGGAASTLAAYNP